MSETRTLRVRSMVCEAEGILGIELVPMTLDTPLPAAEPGAHVDLHLGSGCVRSYSLTNPGERDRWTLAVNLDASSGSTRRCGLARRWKSRARATTFRSTKPRRTAC
jgi:ferredoxin-NADP reductase